MPDDAFDPAERREYEFRKADFDRIRALIRQRAGIHLAEHKQNMVYSRLSRRLRAHAMHSFTEYLDRLERDAQFSRTETQEFVNALTTNLTSFFREAHHFDALAEFLRAGTVREPPKIWCAAASTGEEPYSIAMTMMETAAGRAPGKLLASDIDTGVLETAVRGVYRLDAVQRACGPTRPSRFFLRGTGANEGFVRVRPDLARLVEFAQVNLLATDWPLVRQFAGGAFDAVFCRNVMIYFDKSTQREIMARIAGVLRPGGLLFVGHSENFTDCRETVVLRGKTVYQRL